jgi:hypothetical protein
MRGHNGYRDSSHFRSAVMMDYLHGRGRDRSVASLESIFVVAAEL